MDNKTIYITYWDKLDIVWKCLIGISEKVIAFSLYYVIYKKNKIKRARKGVKCWICLKFQNISFF